MNIYTIFNARTAALGTALFMAAVAGVAFAQEGVRSEARIDVNATPVRVDARLDARADVKAIRDESITAAREKRAALQAEIELKRTEAQTAREKARQDMRSELETVRNDSTLTSEEAREAALQKREEARQMLEVQRGERQQVAEERRASFAVGIEEGRQEAKARMEAVRVELKTRLDVIANERKQEIVERLYARLQAINEKHVANFTRLLNKMEEILQKIVSRTDKAEVSGRDVTAVRSAILSAQGAIASAREAVTVLAANVYVIEVTTEVELRAAVEAAREELRRDVTAVQASVRVVHEALRISATTLAQIPQINALEVEVEAEVEASTETTTPADSNNQ